MRAQLIRAISDLLHWLCCVAGDARLHVAGASSIYGRVKRVGGESSSGSPLRKSSPGDLNRWENKEKKFKNILYTSLRLTKNYGKYIGLKLMSDLFNKINNFTVLHSQEASGHSGVYNYI